MSQEKGQEQKKKRSPMGGKQEPTEFTKLEAPEIGELVKEAKEVEKQVKAERTDLYCNRC